MATGSLYGSVSESTGLYGIGAASGGTYFEWFIFQDSATAPATPTGGSWAFSNNTGTPPSGWVVSPPPAPVNQVWVSIAVVDSRNATTLTWSVPGLMTGSGLPILSASGVPSAGTGLNGQLYINTATTPQSMYFKQSGAWTQLTGSTLYATAGANSNITSLSGLTGGISTADFVQFDTGITPTTAVAKLQWDPTNGGPQIGMAGGNVNLQIGQEEVVYVFNDTGSQINEGQVVKITGSQGQRVTVALAQANNDGNSATILGMATENIANNSSGFVTTQGIVNNVNTLGFADGTIVYLSPTTPGGFTSTKPVAPNHLVLVGYIVKGGSGGGGSVFIHPQNGYELNELHDVLITSVANNNLLRYNSAVPAWVNIAGPSGTIVGTSDTQTLTNKSISGASNTLTNIPNSALVNDSVNVNGVDLTLGAVQTVGADWVLPSYAGNAGKVLTVNPSASDVQWNVVTGTGSVTSVDVSGGSTGLTATGGPITAAGTITLGGTLAVASGGTGATNITAAFNALAPSQTGNAGKYLTTNGTNASWGNITGTLLYQGSWDASTNSPTLTSSVGVNGYYYVVSVAGSTNLNGITDWQIGDWAIFNGTVWQKIDQTNTVSSVNGYTGAVVLTQTDIAGTASLTTTQTLTNKTLTSPIINEILDTNGNEILGLSPTASATDYLTVKNGIGTGVPLHVYADGPSTSIGLHIQPKGSGLVTISDGTDFNKGIRFRSSGSAASAVTLLDAVATAGRVVTLPDATTTLVGRNTTDTLTNKTIDLASNTLQATSAELAAAVTDETGTGSLVFSNSPTFVTPALGTPASGVVTNLTGTASININGTVGATTANTGAFTTLTASADSAFTSTGAVQLSSGTTGQRPTGAAGKLRFNTTTTEFEGYNGTSWASVGGSAISNDTSTATNLFPLFASATTGTASSVFTSNAQYLFKPSTGELSVKVPRASNGIVVNSATISENYTIAAGDNGLSAGPVAVNSGITVTVSSGSVWTVV